MGLVVTSNSPLHNVTPLISIGVSGRCSRFSVRISRKGFVGGAGVGSATVPIRPAEREWLASRGGGRTPMPLVRALIQHVETQSVDAGYELVRWPADGS